MPLASAPAGCAERAQAAFDATGYNSIVLKKSRTTAAIPAQYLSYRSVGRNGFLESVRKHQ